MLTSVLEQTQLVGRPDEYINPRGPFPLHYERVGKGSLQAFFRKIWKETAGPGGIFGIKTPFQDLSPFIQAGLFDEWFRSANFIYLARSNIFEQAVSVVIARQSGVWHHRQGESTPAYRDPPQYDPILLQRALKNLLRERSLWESFFALYEISPLRIVYEDFAFESTALVSAIQCMLRFLGYDVPSDYAVPRPTTIKLASALNTEWADRLRSETSADQDFRRVIEWRDGLCPDHLWTT